MKLLRAVRPVATAHQGGWDEVLLFFGAPITLFVVLRWLGIRKERREQAEQEAAGEEQLLVVARVVHVLSAAVWVGGTVFLVAVAVPYARSLGDERRTAVASAIGRRFRPVAWTSMAGLVVSGLYMLQKLGYLDAGLTSTPDGRLMLTKLILVGLLIGLSALHDFVLGPRLERGETTAGAFMVLARSSGVLTLIVPVIGVLLAH